MGFQRTGGAGFDHRPAVIELFTRPVVREQLAFRGGTALHKLFLKPATRYSEDIDLVQMQAGAIGPVGRSA